MLAIRIIPCLDVDEGRVVKGTNFKGLRDAGDPVELAKKYNEQGADEITFLDIGATWKSRETMKDVVERVSTEVFVPLTVGGGIRTIDDMREILRSGADKVSACSAFLKNPELISKGAALFGSQCMVVSIDAGRTGNSWNCYIGGGRENTGVDAIQWAKDVEKQGAGEILLNSIDGDGTKKGYDLELTAKVASSVNIPVIASGGAGTLEHMFEAITKGHADAVLVASLLHYGEYTVGEMKQFLREKKVAIR